MSQLKLFRKSEYPIVNFKPKRGLKRLSFRFTRTGELNVSYPKHVSKAWVQEQLHKQEEWIVKHYANIKKQQESFQLQPGAHFSFESLSLEWLQAEKVKVNFDGENLQISLPEGAENWTKENTEALLKKALKPIAQAHFKELLDTTAREMDLSYTSLRISSAKTRWGSCSFDNRISISCYAIFLPKTLQKHLIVHELCHVLHKNHGDAFKQMLAKFSPDAARKEKELRRHKIPIV